MTLYKRCYDVKTLKRRHNNVVLISYAGWVKLQKSFAKRFGLFRNKQTHQKNSFLTVPKIRLELARSGILSMGVNLYKLLPGEFRQSMFIFLSNYRTCSKTKKRDFQTCKSCLDFFPGVVIIPHYLWVSEELKSFTMVKFEVFPYLFSQNFDNSNIASENCVWKHVFYMKRRKNNLFYVDLCRFFGFCKSSKIPIRLVVMKKQEPFTRFL